MKQAHSKCISLLLVTALLICCVPYSLAAAAGTDASNVSITISESGGGNGLLRSMSSAGIEISIGNAFVSRKFAINGSTVATTEIVNKRTETDTVFKPGPGSEDFIVNASSTIDGGTQFASSDLQLAGMAQKDIGGGKQLIFTFEPYVLADVPWSVTYNVAMYDGDNYIRSFLELSVPEAYYDTAILNYVDVVAFKLDPAISDDKLFCRPETIWRQYLSDYMTGFGQPIYVNSLFFGVEFTTVDNRIVPFPKEENAELEKSILMRYYSGKTFDQLNKTVDGKFVTWAEIVGAARTSDYEVVQDDFYEYIEEIACKASFRAQFNTWYDGGMNITPASLTNSFMNIEQGLTQSGHQPMDSYVCDDGYNDYSGDFWGWKNAFANDVLSDISKMVTNMGGRFGLWTSPRGGWGAPGNFARIMEMAGTGYRASTNQICVADPHYIAEMKELMIRYQQDYKVTYWKIDGLASQPCTGENHGHMVGGTVPGQTAANSGVYFYVELWENWLDLFAALHENGPDGEDVFLNCTSYSIPSPWILQYVNTVYLQTSADNGNEGYGDYGSKMQNYRDSRYWDFFVNNKFQVPANHIWNHDPDYSSRVGGWAPLTGEELRSVLYNNAMRGTMLYELYYNSSAITEDQWMATTEAMNFARENSYVLKNARLIAPTGVPGTSRATNFSNGLNPNVSNTPYQPYAYSAWVEDEGYLLLRNPANSDTEPETRTITLTLDRIAGVKEGMKDLTMTYVYPSKISDLATYSYGDEISMTLAPNEQVILHFAKPDTTAPSVVRTEANIKNSSELIVPPSGNANAYVEYFYETNKVRVFFDEAVHMTEAMKAGVTVANHTVADVSLSIDCRAVEITVGEAFADNEAISASLTVQDLSLNPAAVTVNARYAEDRIVSAFASAEDLTAGADVNYDALLQSDVLSLDGNIVGFAGGASADETTKLTVSTLVKTTSADAVLVSQAGAYELKLNAEGRPVFTVGDLSVVGDTAVNDGDWHLVTCVKEPNELLKIYLEGTINASAYDGADVNVLKTGAVTIGSAAFKGELADLIISNQSYGWKEIAQLSRRPLGHYVVKNTNAFTLKGMAPSLPKTVQARYDTSEYDRNYEAAWNEVGEEEYAASGKVEIGGTIPDFNEEVLAGQLAVIDAFPAADPLTSLDEERWTILNKNENNLRINENGTRITATPSKMDRGNAKGGYENENFFLTDPGLIDYCATVGINGTPTVLNQQAGLIFYQDDANYVRMTRRISGNAANGATNVFEIHYMVDGQEYATSIPQSQIMSNPAQVYLALDKKGDYYTGYISTNGTDWTKLATVKAALDEPMVGFYAALGMFPVTGINNNYQPTFTNFTIRQHAVGLTFEAGAAIGLERNEQPPAYIWADAVFSDGSEEALLVKLPEIEPELLSAPGVFTVKGVVAGGEEEVDVTVVVAGSNEMIDVTLGVGTIVEFYAANIPVYVDPKYDGAVVTMEGTNETAVVKDGKAVLRIGAAPAAGTAAVKVAFADSAVGYASMKVAGQEGLWAPVIATAADGVTISFAAEVSGNITSDKGVVSRIDEKTLKVACDTGTAGTFILKGVKYPELFPSYSFTFTGIAYDAYVG